MEPGLIWILGGLLLLAAELALPGLFLLWAGIAAIGTGLVVLALLPPFEGVVATFLACLAGSIGCALWLRSRRPRQAVNDPAAGLVGRHGMLLPMEGPALRVRIGDSDWPARLPRDQKVPEAPQRVRVEAVDGVTLIVRPIP
ncbi:NfeD family protein [Roseicella frigidaeris]|uniref:NfeD family protein n=1 Tax=Roseicella frigidaeris TaxID=2230885 RepID=A0A327MCA7_9PROT|nr:NfeD family protein [Roseicella frigidaeris]RAI60145.1 NfeD family protein [Roseicella frigidaeris]